MAKISIEVGHGGKDVGAVTKDGKVFEKDINLTVAMELKHQLERHGQDVLISRETDCDDLAKDFFNKAKAWKPDLHISVHTNAFNGTAKGFEIYRSNIGTYKTRSNELCKRIELQTTNLGQTSRGVKDSPFLLSSLPCVSAYCELGFMDNPIDYKQFDTAAKQKAFAIAYTKGILKYLGKQWVDEKSAEKADGSLALINDSGGKTVYRVIAGVYSEKKNAENWVEELKKQGLESFILQEKKSL
ncbi:MAG: N-acetylmuramoyl-L-alanine amidase [Eubacterium sp.]|jgi:N-acetylmuramoyl-L-alanine amidase|nr:N-acetylmuramoyl-L-alanine amidase [Eubacterium sp.]